MANRKRSEFLMSTKKDFKEGTTCQACKKGKHLDCAYSVGWGYARTKCTCNCNVANPLKNENDDMRSMIQSLRTTK